MADGDQLASTRMCGHLLQQSCRRDPERPGVVIELVTIRATVWVAPRRTTETALASPFIHMSAPISDCGRRADDWLTDLDHRAADRSRNCVETEAANPDDLTRVGLRCGETVLVVVAGAVVVVVVVVVAGAVVVVAGAVVEVEVLGAAEGSALAAG